MRPYITRLSLLFAVVAALSSPVLVQQSWAEENAESKPQVAQSAVGVMRLDQTVISGNQELPKVLYILPWREPQGLPDIEIEAEFMEAEVFRRLYPPAYRRELGYFETLADIKKTGLKEK
jgi:hypothetical protein